MGLFYSLSKREYTTVDVIQLIDAVSQRNCVDYAPSSIKMVLASMKSISIAVNYGLFNDTGRKAHSKVTAG